MTTTAPNRKLGELTHRVNSTKQAKILAVNIIPSGAKLEPLLPPAKKGGRPRTANMREVCNAIFYVLRTGCQWNSLPKDLPAYSTAYYYFRRWQKYGVWEQINAALRAKIRNGSAYRVGLQRNAQPSAAVI